MCVGQEPAQVLLWKEGAGEGMLCLCQILVLILMIIVKFPPSD